MNSSDESDVSGASNWTKGRSRQRLKVPRTLKGNNFISKGVKARKTAPYKVRIPLVKNDCSWKLRTSLW